MAREAAGQQDSNIIEKLVAINRVAKVVKGGRRFGFAALVVVGDGQGKAGFGSGKAREVPEAIRKASEQAHKNMRYVPLREGRTLHHDMKGKFGMGIVMMRAAPPGTGIIAGGPIRAVFEALGVSDVVAKSMGSSNPYNMIKAAFKGLYESDSPRQVAIRRGKKVSEVLRREHGSEIGQETSQDTNQNTGQEIAPATEAKTDAVKANVTAETTKDEAQ